MNSWLFVAAFFMSMSFMVAHAAPHPGGGMSHFDDEFELPDERRLQIFRWMDKFQKVAIAGDPPKFENAREHICIEPRKNVLLARYKTSMSLGYGSFGEVHQVVDTCDPESRNWALKRFFRRNGLEEGARGTLEHEISILDHLGQHGNIMSFEKTIKLQTDRYALMPLMLGTLTADACGAMSLKIMRNLMRQVVEAVHHAHSKNVVISDLKMDNILVESIKPLKIRLSDLGLATIGETTTGRAGSPAYMPLEKRHRLKFGNYKSDDIWAIGMLMRFLLADQHDHLSAIYNLISAKLATRPRMRHDKNWLLTLTDYSDQIYSGYGEVPEKVMVLINQQLRKYARHEEDRAFLINVVALHDHIDKNFPEEFKADEQFMSFFKACLQFDVDERANIELLRDHLFLREEDKSQLVK